MKEEIMIKAFIKGLSYKNIRSALKIFKPQTLEEAVEFVKDECLQAIKNETDDNNIWILNKENEMIQSLKQQIEILKSEISRLKNRQGSGRKESEPWRTSLPNNFQRKNERRCFKCDKIGHIARFCKKRQCFGCGGDHLIKYCRKEKQLRYFQEDELDNTDNADTESEKMENSNVNTISENGWLETNSLKLQNKPKLTLEDKYCNYINGNGAKPKMALKKYEPTLISTSRPEKARNKPIVECNVANMPVKVMFDTGADLNVINQELVEKICKKNPAVKIFNSATRVTCANRTTEICVGKVQLNVVIGPTVTAHVFDVMPNIFPHMFIGLRSMKKYEVKVNAADDCIEIQNIKLPFISKTIAAESLNC